MDTKDFSKKVLDTIKKEKIKPKPRWEFLLKDYFVWTLFILSVFIGSISVSVLTFIIRHEELFRFGPEDPVKNILSTIPYFWLLTLLLFLFLAYLNFKHTKTGYRYNILKVFILSIVSSLIFGSLFYYFGISEKIERGAYNRLPLYKNVMDGRAKMMFSPEDGYLGGVVVKIGETNIEVKSFDGKIWSVNLEKLDIGSVPEFKLYSRVKVVGSKIDEDVFEASQIIPWAKKGLRPPGQHLNYLDERNNPKMRIIR